MRKRCSLLISEEEKSFKTLPPGVNAIKLFSFIIDDEA
jgi:hypothetical protein